MAYDLNKAMLIGRVNNIKIRHFDNNRACTTFSLVTNKRYKNKNGDPVEKASWHNIVLWSPLAEIAERYLEKGKQVYIEGEIETRSYQSNTGEKKYTTEIIGKNLILLGGAKSNPTKIDTEKPIPVEESESPTTNSADDLPF